MKKLILVLALSLPIFANPSLYTRYESVRQGFLKNTLADVNKSAAALAADARAAKNGSVAKFADAVAKAPDIEKARAAFATLSDELIRQRATAAGAKPSVYYCPMVRKSWLQAKGQVGNPYDAAMSMCGELKAE